MSPQNSDDGIPALSTLAQTPPTPSGALGDGASSGASTASTTTPATTTMSDSGVELDAEDLAAMAEVKKKGYRYFARKLGAEETAAIGDITPKAMVVTAVPAAAPASFAPQLVTAAAAPSSISTKSEWNSANTFEERSLGSWTKARLVELVKEGARSGKLVAPLPGVGRLVVTGIDNWGNSSSDIVISRGKTRYIYDMHFSLVATVVPEVEGGGEISDDDDGGASSRAVASVAPPAMSTAAFVDSGAADNSSSSTAADMTDDSTVPALVTPVTPSAPSGTPTLTAANGADRKKHPRVLLVFPNVANDSEEDVASGKGREVRVEWGTPAPPEGQQELLRRVVAVGGPHGLAASCQAIVEQVVAEYKRK